MSTLGYLFVLLGILVVRSAARGRATDIPTDISDAFLAILRGDSDSLGEVLTRKGEGLTATETDLSKYESTAAMGDLPNAGAGKIAAEAVKLGTAAKGYRWTATGPEYYDCSGLMWRTVKNLGIYTGPRFTTHHVASLSAFTKVTDPKNDDLVVWPNHHMGVVTGPDTYYSARSVASGIGYSKISSYPKGKAIYLRANGNG